MQFTPYIPIDSSGGTLDPLSFLRPSGQLKDRLFNQFTLLSRYPAYHGALCCLFDMVTEGGIAAAQKDFSRTFREVELFFGLLNSSPDVASMNMDVIGQSILNITKYEILHSTGMTSYAQAKRWKPIFDRLSYGTLGHYAGPSRRWGLLDTKGQQLTPLGIRLASCWGQRGATSFQALWEAWSSGATLEEVLPEAKVYALGAPPTAEEQACWRAVIEQYTVYYQDCLPLWNEPPSDDLLALSLDEKSYPGFFPGLLEHYVQYPELCERIELCGLFDAVAGLASLVFEWEYVRRLFDDKVVSDYHAVENAVVDSLPALLDRLASLSATQNFFWDLADVLGTLSTWEELSTAILQHHERHQRRKKVSPYILDGAIVIHGRVEPAPVIGLLEAIHASPEALTKLCRWHYRRNWHFGKIPIWRSYAGYDA